MRQNQDNTAFRRGSELALQANYWTGYLALARTNRLANHTKEQNGEICVRRRCGLDLNLALSGRRFGASLKIHVNAPEKHVC